ncbi:bifunctional DNA primase/polymerase [Nocardia cyriacigeorgica]|uniref:Bifunctional DNA primase/polymerase, N-terminal n=1 Tax=Nocardia cyriacigeorgica TaxID=135487 RepID=A0A4U8VVJ2_9NOCA|nr:bifunctional DNA primase/polymerase [Nocardia cyriacigeorgica]VFA96349.1 Bifunctional DNA primase/polymerase, N-terminal [Nocardia cyriacigeorgica]
MSSEPSLRAAALAAAARGWPVFPLRPAAKTPAINRWPDRASTDSTRINRWWRQCTSFNIGIVTGTAAGLHVIDLDSQHLLPTVERFEDALAQLTEQVALAVPATFTVATPAGWHLYFHAPHRRQLGSTIGRLGPGIDSRGDGGYIVAPGSRTTVGDYRVLRRVPVAPLPIAIAQRLRPPPPSPLVTPTGPVHLDRYVAAIVVREADRVARATPGSRNVAVFRSALTLGRLVAAGDLSPAHARNALIDAAHTHVGIEGFTAAEAERAITNGFRYTAHHPRRLRRQ